MAVVRTWVTIGILSIGFSFAVSAICVGEEEEAGVLADMALRVHREVDRASYGEARVQLVHLTEQFANSLHLGRRLRLHGIHILSSLLLSLETELNRAAVDPMRVQVIAHQLLLACDALARRHQPLWQRNYDSLRVPALQWWRLLSGGASPKEGQGLLLHLQQAYRIIRPAIFLDRTEEMVGELDSLLIYLQQYHTPQQTISGLRRWLQVLGEVFQPQGERVTMTSVQGSHGAAANVATLLMIWIGFVFLYVTIRRCNIFPFSARHRLRE
ncbi:sporulation protein YpjB [Pasteuria penetrans]|uniref:sporulation protein YpjB n=1 Tax=Pasteuria penetrans TaxID=86005 RepID=UPI000FAFCE43|nr:sporulation protein YpjB [Pasteuria penetrans]